jgi:hypothetical protein
MKNGAFVCCATPGGFLDPGRLRDGRLSDGREVIVVPLDSGEDVGVIDALVFASTSGRIKYVADIHSESGGVKVWVSGDTIQVEWSVYSGDEAMCCPSHFAEHTFSLVGAQLVKLREWTRSSPLPHP